MAYILSYNIQLSLLAVRWRNQSHFEKNTHFRDWPLAGIDISRPNKGVALNKGDNANSCSETRLRYYSGSFCTQGNGTKGLTESFYLTLKFCFGLTESCNRRFNVPFILIPSPCSSGASVLSLTTFRNLESGGEKVFFDKNGYRKSPRRVRQSIIRKC